MAPLRARLAASRPKARAYAASLATLPADLAGATARLASLHVYPVKAFGGLAVQSVRVDRLGLLDPGAGLRDRMAMLAVARPGANSTGEAFDAYALTNRLESATSRIRARLDGSALVYEAPGVEPLRLAAADLAPRDGPTRRVRLWQDGAILDGVVSDGPLAAWTRALLAAHPARRRFAPEDVVEVRPPATFARPVGARHRAGEDAGTVYGDGGHFLVANAATLAWMNADLARAGGREIPMEAFRPNVVLAELPANAEDVIGEVEVAGRDGPVPVAFASLCTRCDATRVDPATGTKPDKEPLRWLAANRPPREDDAASATFAVNATARAAGLGRSLAVGDRVRVLSERA